VRVLSIIRSQWFVPATLLVAVSVVAAAAATNWRSRVSANLLVVYDAATTSVAPSIKATQPATSATERPTARFDALGRVQVDVNFDCAVAAPTTALVAAGLLIDTTVKAPPLCVVEGWAATAALPSLAAVAGVKMVELPHYAKTPVPIVSTGHSVAEALAMPQAGGSTPAIDGNGVTIMNADKYIAQTGANGAGITVGVINFGADSLSVIQGRGELPQVSVVNVSANPPPANQDEGTVMLEEVHAVAPGANLVFCGPQTYAQYVSCVQNLIAANVTVLTDDLLFWGFDVMSDPAQNAGSQAVENLLAANPNVMIFSAAGNNAKNYWQGSYTPTTIGAGSFTCQGQTDNYFELFTGTHAYNLWTLGGSSGSDLLLAWENSGKLSTSNYDLYVLDGSLNVIACAAGNGSTAVSGSTTYDVINSSSLSSPNTYYILIGTPDTSLNGEYLKLIGFGDGADSWSSTTSGSTSSPQDFAAGVFTIGAVDGGDGVGANIESFSATGPVQFASGATLQAPILVAPDDIYVDIVGTSFSQAMFKGTSAASPNSAAVAALIRSAFPSLTSAQTINAMQTGAAPLGASGTFGAGRVDAIGALGALTAPSISGFQTTTIVGGTSSPPLPITVGGTGALGLSVTPASLIPAGSPGVVVSPANCGNPTTACTVTLTPTMGQSGPTTVQLTITDGAKRTMSYQASVTVTKPAAPTISITSGGSQSVNVNAPIAPVMFTLAGTGPLTLTTATTGIGSFTVTSGCGTTTMTCTATLGTASATAGTASLMLSVQDSFSQSGVASANVTVSAPSSGGGGSLDPWALLGLTGLVLVQLNRSQRRRQC
jgi:Subtilase family